MTKEQALQELRELWEYSELKCWPQKEQEALKFAVDFIEKHKDDFDDEY
jgi:hypothetical protein